MYMIGLGSVVMCMGTDMFMDVLLMIIDLWIQICCLCDIMFYAICVIRRISFTSNTDVVLPPSSNHVAGGREWNGVQHVDFGMRG